MQTLIFWNGLDVQNLTRFQLNWSQLLLGFEELLKSSAEEENDERDEENKKEEEEEVDDFNWSNKIGFLSAIETMAWR